MLYTCLLLISVVTNFGLGLMAWFFFDQWDICHLIAKDWRERSKEDTTRIIKLTSELEECRGQLHDINLISRGKNLK